MKYRLVDLEATFIEFVKHCDNSLSFSMRYRDGLAGSQGVRFLCPHCYEQNGGAEGTHGVLVWFANRGVPDTVAPHERWEMRGDGLHNLTLTPSVHLRTGCRWHGFVTNGVVSSV